MVTADNKVNFSILGSLWQAPGSEAAKNGDKAAIDRETHREGEQGNEQGKNRETQQQEEPKTNRETHSKPPETDAEAPRNLYTLSDEQQAYINRTKAEILEQIYTADDTASLFLKALGVMAVCLNDKAYYTKAARLIKTIWVDGLGKIRTLEEIPGEFALDGINKYKQILESSLKEKRLDTQTRSDLTTAIEKMSEKGKAFYKRLPETSKASFESV